MQMAFDAVSQHRFRSLLTMLGIVIGITTVVTVSSLLAGVQKGIVTFFEEFGTNNVFLNRTSGDPSRPPRKEQRRRPLDPAYATLIKRLAPSVQDVGMQMFYGGTLRSPVVAKVPGFETDRVVMVGYTANFFEIQPRDLTEGRIFTPNEAARAAKVAVIGPSLSAVLFPTGNAVGRAVNVGGAEFIVIGVFAAAKGGFFGENELDYQVAVPYETLKSRFPQLDNYLFNILAKEGMRDQALEEVRSILRRLRRVPAGTDDDFSLSTADQIIKSFNQITGIAYLISTALSGLGLLVGGIGVMNIMLVSVTERTREIGIRKALGARKGDIVFQFLTEAVTLTGTGGVIGIILSVLMTLGIGALVPALGGEVPLWAVVAGFGTSVSVGIFFGVWPAVKASRLDPVEALRYE
jgi:putative ABC transport system permease protein